MAKVLGVGGIFFKCEDVDAVKAWYRDVLGIEPNDYGGFDFLHAPAVEAFPKGARTIFSPFPLDVDYFEPSRESYMINLMVDDLDGMIERIKKAGVSLEGDPQNFDYGRFAWVMAPNGIKIELWQPIEPKG